ncbi:MAG: 2-amino-4-hydroxy-6-hydroxymethyldihydropteridine diphosphokinase [Williamsia sp.]|nr:2-amino-4-hydroxy-6-hydroxymethyldihydropteridine diphosphokinase [Williamsia sp.]
MNWQYYSTVYLLIGGNIGDRWAHLEQAATLIGACCGTITERSPVYETAAWGLTDQAPFLNQALRLQTSGTAEWLMKQLLQIEEQMGRIREKRYGPRIIDIDILLFNDEIHTTSLVTIPHPEMPKRRFALQPLADLAPAVQHPVLKKSIAEILAVCPDELPVKKVQRPAAGNAGPEL